MERSCNLGPERQARQGKTTAPMASDPARLIRQLELQPHPEGGWYRELHRSAVGVVRQDDGQPRAGLTLIAFLLQAGESSRWHRVRQADELWYHGGGAPLDLLRLPPQGGSTEHLRLGRLDAADPQQQPVQLIPADWWQAARSMGDWSLSYCSVGPGFDFADFNLLADLPLAERPDGADPALI
ncbi:cupin domain-containing protein [Synechococcus sp. CS-1328]|uniref:cupin domain-containing protein n=1 Tax=Synechococcus sp. CS-1328 TaxID=2847976 RepID=UPI0028806542|nr:cupin domain-containing protein [Synechococcus sp. CS-1328]